MRAPALITAIIAAAFLASPASAAPTLASGRSGDVRAGVDAWSRGDYPRAIKEWQGPAAKGDADAQFNLAQAYKLGRGVPPDIRKAEEYYRAAAQSGHARAADNYGLLLFQSNRQGEAMPWLQQSADRGEPRAQYLVGVAAFNGDFAPKDWVRAYALMTRAAASGLPQAISGLATMNQTIPLNQRQIGTQLAGELQQREERARATQLGAVDLGAGALLPPSPPMTAPPPPVQVATAALPAAQPRGPAPAYASDPTRAITVGAAQAGLVTMPPRKATGGAAAAPVARAAPVPAKPPTVAAPVALRGPWRVQLGAFGQKPNADSLWARVRTRAEIAGHPRVDLAAGGVTRLQAGGFASENAANAACASLKSGGFSCLVVKP